MPQNAASFTQHQQQLRYNNSNRGASNNNGNNSMGTNLQNGRKKIMGNINGIQGYRFNKNIPKFGQQPQQQQQQQSQQQQSQQQQGVSGVSTFKQAYPQVFYGSSNNSATSLAPQVASPTMYGSSAQPNQQFMTASSSSSSTPPPRLHVSVSGASSISSLGGEFDYLLPNDLNGQLMPSATAQVPQPPALNCVSSSASMSGTYLDPVPAAPSAGFKMNGGISSSNDFINGLPSSLLSEGAAASEFIGMNGSNSLFNANSINSSVGAAAGLAPSNNFMMHNSKNWGTNNPSSSSTSGSFGIWNNDMSVWS